MNKLIWKMYNENRISLEVAEELLDCYYNRTNKIYQMYNNATFIDKEQLKNLNKIDNWLVKENTKIPDDVVIECREVITKIIEKGHYFEGQAEVLNMLASEYNKWKKSKRQEYGKTKYNNKKY